MLNAKGQVVCRDPKESERMISDWIKGGPVPVAEQLTRKESDGQHAGPSGGSVPRETPG